MSTPPLSELQGRKIGRVLVKLGKVKPAEVEAALKEQKKTQMPLGETLMKMGFINQDDIQLARACQEGLQMMSVKELDIPPSVITQISGEMANTYQVLPIAYDASNNTLKVALKSADNFRAMDDLQLLMGFKVEAVVAPADEIAKRLEQLYGDDEDSIGDLLGEMDSDDLEQFGRAGGDIESQAAAADDNRIKKLLNLILLQAIKERAADIHIEPFEDELKLRYRIDGVLYEMSPPPLQLAPALSSRVKIMADLDIAERRLPQDGRIELSMRGNPVDLRVSILPTMWGEAIVMRILDRTNTSLQLDTLGIRDDQLDGFRQLIRKPNGVVVVTGPTGSGKTTTLYSALSELNEVSEKICTAEDPVEYDIDGMIQVPINAGVGLTFAAALRSFLRQDPDIILVGETRDLETARISVQAALTGHLVFTTLHTNDAPSSIARLLDLGLEPFLITACLEGVLAQRLVRKICKNCKEPFAPSDRDLFPLRLKPEDLAGRKLYTGKGCSNCSGSGYSGRLGLYELMVTNDKIRQLVLNHASSNQIMIEAKKAGMSTLRENGVAAVLDGITSIDEVVRETLDEM